MSDTAKVLTFRPRKNVPEGVFGRDALIAANSYLATPVEDRSARFQERNLSDPEILVALCATLKELCEVRPAVAAEEACAVYQWLAAPGRSVGLFDEYHYYLGEVALRAASAFRYVGRFNEAEDWLDRADAAFRHTINSAPLLANVAFARLALRYGTGRYASVLELLPSLTASFQKLGMQLEGSKCAFLKAMTLKMTGRVEEAFSVLQEMRLSPYVKAEGSLYGQVLVHIGNFYGSIGEFETAANTYVEALPVIQASNRPQALAELKWSIGDTYRAQTKNGKALEAYRSALSEYQMLGMRGFASLMHLVIAELLLELGRPREAEWEILAALPTIDEEGMAPEGFAAVALLKESVRQRKTDQNALRELREHLQAKS